MVRDPAAALLAILILLAVSAAVLLLAGRVYGVALIACIAFIARALRGINVQTSGYVSDAWQYDSFAMDLVRYWQHAGPDPGSWLGKEGFPTMLAVIYSTIGHAPEVGYLINALAGGLTVIVTAATVRQMGWEPAIKPAAWIVALWPVAVLWGGLLLREAIVTLLLGVGLWGMVRIYKHHYISGVVAIAGSGVLMIPMRGGLAFLILIGMPVTAALAANLRFKLSPASIGFAIVAGIASAFLLRALASYFDGSQYFEYRADVSMDQNRGNSSFAEAGLGSGAVDQSPKGLAVRTLLTAFGPFVFQIRNPSLFLAGIDALLWIGIWILVIVAVKRLRSRAEALLFAVPAIALIVYLAANSSNFGLIIRLRGLAIVLVAPLAGFGWAIWRQHRRRQKSLRMREREPAARLELEGVLR